MSFYGLQNLYFSTDGQKMRPTVRIGNNTNLQQSLDDHMTVQA